MVWMVNIVMRMHVESGWYWTAIRWSGMREVTSIRSSFRKRNISAQLKLANDDETGEECKSALCVSPKIRPFLSRSDIEISHHAGATMKHEETKSRAKFRTGFRPKGYCYWCFTLDTAKFLIANCQVSSWYCHLVHCITGDLQTDHTMQFSKEMFCVKPDAWVEICH